MKNFTFNYAINLGSVTEEEEDKVDFKFVILTL